MLLTSLNGASFPQQHAYVEQALAAARRAGSREQEAFILFDSWYYYGTVGQWQTGLKNLLEALELWRELGNIPLLSETHARLEYVNWFLGEYDRALAYGEEGFRLAKHSNNIEAQAINLSAMGMIYIDLGELQRGLDVMQEAVALGLQGEVVTAVGGTQADLGWAYGWLGRSPQESIEPVAKAVTWFDERMSHISGFALAPLARLYLLIGDADQARKTLEKLVSYQEQRRRVGFVTSIWVATGLAEIELALRDDRPNEALEIAESLRAVMEKDGVRYLLADVILLTADCLTQIGRVDEAASALDAAENVARSIGSRRILWEIIACKGDLARARGEQDAAEECYRLSRQMIEEMADTLESPELRMSFRQRAAARLPGISYWSESKLKREV
jgi:tetratricopeptide (TPR) repeat protein